MSLKETIWERFFWSLGKVFAAEFLLAVMLGLVGAVAVFLKWCWLFVTR